MSRIADRRHDRRRPSRIFSPSDARRQPISAPDDPSRGILRTEVSRSLARAIAIVFVGAIAAIPMVQAAVELARDGRIQAFDVFRGVPTRSHLSRFERELTQRSMARRTVQPELQAGLTGYLGFGTTRAIPGLDGWLFFRPGIDWVAGPGLLDPFWQARHAREMAEAGLVRPAPDPLAAILAYHDDCRRAGVRLVVVPVPDKVSLEAHRLSHRFDAMGPYKPPTNVDYQKFVDKLRLSGVDVLDPTPEMIDPRGPDRFLKHDSHWTPEWMGEVARTVADHLKTVLPAIPGEARLWRVEPTPASRLGDVAQMLQLGDDQTLYPPQTVTIDRVIDAATGRPFRPVEGASIVLLGDSFSNIYSTPDLGWGDSAGLPAQLARRLGRDIDVIARNGADAQAIWAELARRPDPLSGKVAVVWAFADRKLTRGNWGAVLVGPGRRKATDGKPGIDRHRPTMEEVTR